MRQVDAVVTALLLFISLSGLNALVPAPENVTVKCENQRTTVQWDYSDQRPNTTFIVSLSESHEVRTLDREFDLSRFIWESEDHYMDFHYVSVTALQGSNRSAPVPSQTFSFNRFKTTDITCKLDFPPVKLTVEESEATVTFDNPFHFYKELERANKPSTAVFSFKVVFENNDHTQCRCGVDQRRCKCSFEIPEDTEPCVTLSGQIVEGNVVGGHIQFNEKGHVCPEPFVEPEPTRAHWLAVALMLTIVSFVIIGLTVAICKLRAWTLKTPPLPNPLVSNPQSHSKPRTLIEHAPDFSPIQIIGFRAPPFDPEEDSPPADAPDKSEATALILQEPHDDKYTDSLDTETFSLHSSLSSSSLEMEWPLYEARPHLVNMNLGDGDEDMVTAYTAS